MRWAMRPANLCLARDTYERTQWLVRIVGLMLLSGTLLAGCQEKPLLSLTLAWDQPDLESQKWEPWRTYLRAYNVYYTRDKSKTCLRVQASHPSYCPSEKAASTSSGEADKSHCITFHCLLPGQYDFWVTADYGACGESEPSNVVQYTISPPAVTCPEPGQAVACSQTAQPIPKNCPPLQSSALPGPNR